MRLGTGLPAVLGCAAVLAGAAPASAQLPLLGLTPEDTGLSPPPGYTNPVLPGDYPDPSVLRDGRDYWAVTTSGGWRPPFTILHSRDLINWDVAGSVLRSAPEWAIGDFWAPELVKRGRRYLVYYAARSTRGRFCIGVASARRPTRFFRDRGRVVCTRYGAIDPAPIYDERGRFHLAWKEDGNARARPTPIRAAPLSPGGLRLAGRPRELFRNDQRWEGGVVEAPTLVRHRGQLYVLYSGGYCCGPRCNYKLGVARSPTLIGRWEKHPVPLLTGTPSFKCPGHASVVEGPDRATYLLYHAYTAAEGRQVLLDRIEWGPDGWPRVAGGVPSAHAPAPRGAKQYRRPQPFEDEFRSRYLTAGWTWTANRPLMSVRADVHGRLWMEPRPGRREGVVARQTGVSTWVAETVVGRRRRHAAAGLAAYLDELHGAGIEVTGRNAIAWTRDGGATRTLGAVRIGRPRFVPLRITAHPGRRLSFDVGNRRGWTRVAGPQPAPGWRGESRVVLRVLRGRAAFERFSLRPLGEDR